MKVPQLFAASGATTWGRDAAKYPWTIGFQPSYAAEGWVYGQYVAKRRGRRRSPFSSRNDDYEDLGGSGRGLGRSGSKVIAAQPYQVTSPDVGSQIARLKASGANVLAIFATPTFAIQAYVFANRLGWRPLVINNGVSGTSNIMLLASEGGKNKAVEGTITSTILSDPTDPRWKNDRGMKLYRSLMGALRGRGERQRRLPRLRHGGGLRDGRALKRLGANPTRAASWSALARSRARGEPVPASGRVREDRQGRQLPDPAGQLQRWTKGRCVRSAGSGSRSATGRRRRPRRPWNRPRCRPDCCGLAP